MATKPTFWDRVLGRNIDQLDELGYTVDEVAAIAEEDQRLLKLAQAARDHAIIVPVPIVDNEVDETATRKLFDDLLLTELRTRPRAVVLVPVPAKRKI